MTIGQKEFENQPKQTLDAEPIFAKIGELFVSNGNLMKRVNQLEIMLNAVEKENKALKEELEKLKPEKPNEEKQA